MLRAALQGNVVLVCSHLSTRRQLIVVPGEPVRAKRVELSVVTEVSRFLCDCVTTCRIGLVRRYSNNLQATLTPGLFDHPPYCFTTA